MSNKPKVLICVLCGTERQQWINPDLSLLLINAGKDARFEVCFSMVRDKRPYDCARNTTIDLARRISADWVVSYDNDIRPYVSPLDVIANAGEDKQVIGSVYGIGSVGPGGRHWMFPPDVPANDPNFQEAYVVGGGFLIVHRSVWERIPKGPWFRWVPDENELLEPGPGLMTEDVYFCELAHKHGIKIWAYRLAGHLRTMDVTAVGCTLMEGRDDS
jgi:hypothetical protein